MDNMDDNKVAASDVRKEAVKVSGWPMVLASVAFAAFFIIM